MKLVALSLAALACTTFQPQIAHAQAEILMVRLCKKITDDSARLKCFDAIGAEAKSAEEKAKSFPPQWEFKESRSPIDDSPQVIATLESEDGESSFMVRCQEKRTEVAFLHKSLFVFEKGTVLVRINDLQPASATWTAANNNRAMFAPSPMTFAKMLPDNAKLFIRATGRSQSVDGSFQLGDVSAMRARISSACRWSATEATATPAAPAPQAPKAAPVPFLPTH